MGNCTLKQTKRTHKARFSFIFKFCLSLIFKNVYKAYLMAHWLQWWLFRLKAHFPFSFDSQCFCRILTLYTNEANPEVQSVRNLWIMREYEKREPGGQIITLKTLLTPLLSGHHLILSHHLPFSSISAPQTRQTPEPALSNRTPL